MSTYKNFSHQIKLIAKNLKNKILSFIKNKNILKKMSKNSFSLGDENSLLKLSKIIC